MIRFIKLEKKRHNCVFFFAQKQASVIETLLCDMKINTIFKYIIYH